VRLEPIKDVATRDSLLCGDHGGWATAPGWPHDDTKPGLSFIDSGGWAFLVIDDEDRIAGECGTKLPPDHNGWVEIGYGLAAPSRGRGLGTAAVRELVRWLSERPEVSVIEAEVHVGNVASYRVLERLGFGPSGSVVNGHTRYSLGHVQ
jgi:RimJ/RimL family protein N-acetyltransferase